MLDDILTRAMQRDVIADGVLAQSETQSEAQKAEGYPLSFDISIPIDAIADAIVRLDAAIAAEYPRPSPAHLGRHTTRFGNPVT